MRFATLAATAAVFLVVAWIMAYSAMGMMMELQAQPSRAAQQCAALGEFCGADQ